MSDLIDEWKQELINNEKYEKEIESVEVPETCLTCKSYNDPKEKVDCICHRYRQRNNRKFKCRGFIEIEYK